MEGRSLYRTVAAIGLAAHALAALIYFAVGPGGEDGVFFLVIAAVGLAAAAITWTWSKGIWVSLVLGLLLELATFWFVFPLFQGFALSALDAVPALIGFVGIWTAIIASILGVARRKNPRMFSDTTKRKLLIGVGVIVALAVASSALTVVNKETVSDADAAGATSLLMHNADEFSPTTLEATASEEVRLLVKNDDPFAHTFTLDKKGYDVNEVVGPGSEKIITFTAKGAGKVEYVCEFHDEMKGTLVVT